MSLPFAYAAGGGVLLLVAIVRMGRAGVGPRAGDLAVALAAAVFLTSLAAMITRL